MAKDRVEGRIKLRRSSGRTGLLTLLCVGIALGVFACGGFVLWQTRDFCWRQAEQASDNLVLALGRDIARNIEFYDLSLQGAVSAWKHPGLQQTAPEIRRMAIFDRAAAAEYLGAMLITDADGHVVADSTSASPQRISLAQREHFLVHQRRPDMGLYISRPFEGRVVTEPIVVLTRRISGADGQFDGVVSGAVRLTYFANLFDKLNIGSNGSVTLFRTDGRVIMRRPFRATDIDRDLGSTRAFQAYLKQPHGHLVDRSTLDGTERLYTFYHIEGLPLILSVAVGTDEIYAPWWSQALEITAVLLVLCGSTITLCYLFRREIERRLAAESSLIEAAGHLSVLAATDGLTGILNRRSFEMALEQEWRRAIRAETSVALLMLDADWFKAFNDHYGHQEGDEVLKKLAGCIDRNVRRPGDTPARYGGEEFVALLGDTDLNGSLVVAENIRKAIVDLGIPHAKSPHGQLTVSVGVAVLYPVQDQPESLLVKYADAALYEAKRAGRNRISVSQPSQHTVVQWQSNMRVHGV